MRSASRPPTGQPKSSSVGSGWNLKAQRRQARGGLRPGSQRPEHHGAERGAQREQRHDWHPATICRRRDGRGGWRRRILAHPSQLAGDVADALPSAVGVLLEAAAQDVIEQRVRTANPLVRRRLAALDGGDHVQEVDPVEGLAAGQQLVEHASEREDVGTRVAAWPSICSGAMS